MKQAFSLLELVLSLVIFGIIVYVLTSPSLQIYKRVFEIKNKNSIFFDLNQALLGIEKIYQTCIEFKYDANYFECYMSANDDIFYDVNLKVLNFSGIVLDRENFISPNSRFYFIENGVLNGVLSNYKDLHLAKKQKIYPYDFIYIYALNDNKIYKVYIQDKENVNFYGESFSGFYYVVYAFIKIIYEDKKIFFEIKDFENRQDRFLFADEIDQFSIDKDQNFIKITLCKNDDCLSKWMFK
ncbi:prepilin-type N-terminal cleavage/methylation domain-containing protein [Campylobacter volucris]|uniref:prepilin-type N-terminal cleavage/methylation domain-containing protein n=1 Tax=Campylobacter volucris TaxID=1031542 RepID=UPI00189D5F33|nr:prepilin-type N-terminal cleavage/methylation domain-containing protein [Campylobacter volucris]MBF7049248.1 prepilin-type N-terminal cleavage/methylation domain-containing protein [Campylobacter volucris]MBF7059695.1 prepilin-type N-terminal cleavage/methylation domain-containing protein [Campylobacter volucris]